MIPEEVLGQRRVGKLLQLIHSRMRSPREIEHPRKSPQPRVCLLACG